MFPHSLSGTAYSSLFFQVDREEKNTDELSSLPISTGILFSTLLLTDFIHIQVLYLHMTHLSVTTLVLRTSTSLVIATASNFVIEAFCTFL
jgi:uncharacterized membrane protein